MLSQKIQAELKLAALKHYQLKPEEVELEVPKELSHGDFTTPVALRVASRWGVTPRVAAETLVEELNNSPVIKKIISRIEIAGPGFINFWVKPEILAQSLNKLLSSDNLSLYKKQRVVVEYSSPNIAKPMHIGHIRSTLIGQAIGNIYEALGAQVIRLNHLGDWGTQFGKLIVAFKMWGSRAAVKKNPIDELLKLYVKFHEVMKENPELEKQGQEAFKQLELGNRQMRSLWNWFKSESLKEFNSIYKRLGIKFNHITGESFYEPKLKGVVSDLLKRKIATKNSDGSVVAYLEKEGLPPCLIQKSDGASLYATRDLAAIQYRLKHYKPQSMWYVVGNEQSLHFDQLFTVASKAGYSGNAKLGHIKFGLILGEDGQKLATREGRIIKLDEILNKAVEMARDIVDKKNPKLSPKQKKEVAENVGLGAVKYNDLSQNRLTDITFNWNKMLSWEGNSGPYLQYTYVRLKSILRKASSKKSKSKSVKFSNQLINIAEKSDINMARLLLRYPESLIKAAKEQGPHMLALYLYELSVAANSYYHDTPVLKAGSNELKELRLQLVSMCAQVLRHGLNILGIKTVEEM